MSKKERALKFVEALQELMAECNVTIDLDYDTIDPSNVTIEITDNYDNEMIVSIDSMFINKYTIIDLRDKLNSM